MTDVDADATAVAAICDEHPGISTSAARFVHILQCAQGRLLPYDFIAGRLRDITGEYPTQEAMRSAAKRARQHGFQIEAQYDVGYRIALQSPALQSPATRSLVDGDVFIFLPGRAV